MHRYRFGYHADLLAQFPTIVAGAGFALGIDNESEERAAQALVRAQEQVAKAQFGSEPLSSHPHISSWRSAYSSFGVKPTQYRCAVEALLRHVVKGGTVPHINKV
ncbi:MAG TPA: hypothetical protein VJ714_07655, partial [Anaerolineae bacterium]|nr:hypothetical protein [Anaerolineae bacterium]